LFVNMQAGHDLELAQERLQHELANIEPAPPHDPSAAISTGNKRDYVFETTGRSVLRRTTKLGTDPPRGRRVS
jgi:hypothetical protein